MTNRTIFVLPYRQSRGDLFAIALILSKHGKRQFRIDKNVEIYFEFHDHSKNYKGSSTVRYILIGCGDSMFYPPRLDRDITPAHIVRDELIQTGAAKEADVDYLAALFESLKMESTSLTEIETILNIVLEKREDPHQVLMWAIRGLAFLITGLEAAERQRQGGLLKFINTSKLGRKNSACVVKQILVGQVLAESKAEEPLYLQGYELLIIHRPPDAKAGTVQIRQVKSKPVYMAPIAAALRLADYLKAGNQEKPSWLSSASAPMNIDGVYWFYNTEAENISNGSSAHPTTPSTLLSREEIWRIVERVLMLGAKTPMNDLWEIVPTFLDTYTPVNMDETRQLIEN